MTPQSPAEPLKILIADDDAVSRQVLRAALISLGHQVVAVDNGVRALAAMSESDAPNLAILDWMMPEMDGMAVCRALREQPRPYVYIILLTARDADADMIEALDGGADDFITKPFKLAELRARLRAGQRVLALQDHLLQSRAVLEHDASHDRLTTVWNRGRILDELSRELRRAAREEAAVAVVMADVDHFKRINDMHGHAAGDAVLRHVAQRIRTTLRASDSVGRYGGEEFLLVLPRADLSAAREVAERVRAAIETLSLAEPSGLTVTASFGVACSSDHATQETLLHAADTALYRAKAGGRNRVDS